MQVVLIRSAAYFLMAVFLGELIRLELGSDESVRRFTEYGYVQWVQSVILIACSVLLFLKARVSVFYRHLYVCMAFFFLALLVRENDQPLELFLPHGSWKYIVVFPVAALAMYFAKHRRLVLEQLVVYSRTLSFGVMLSGFMVLVFSRLFGRKRFWQELMGDEYFRMVKNVAEEGVEVLALGLILIAVVELFISRDTQPTTG